jgi:spore protease
VSSSSGSIFSVYTDLALEETERLTAQAGPHIPGVDVIQEPIDGIQVTRVQVATEEAERAMGKERGRYITIEAPGIQDKNRLAQEKVSSVLAKELASLCSLGAHTTVLIIGLGNWNATPDALGPKVISHVLVTRHLQGYVPPELKGTLRSVSAFAPGVMGLTGIETSEIVRGVVDRVKPDLVLCVDALCARSVERLMTTIQLADTGIQPGSGVGNRRQGITTKSLGIPVVALGVPTVVAAITIAADTVDILVNQLKGTVGFYQILQEMGHDDKRRLVNEVLSPSVGDLVVTPKEVDVMVDEVSRVVSGGLNMALHPSIGPDDLARYIQ